MSNPTESYAKGDSIPVGEKDSGIRISRILFRKHRKRERRRCRRIEEAKQRAHMEATELDLRKQKPDYLTRLADQQALELCRLQEERRISEENNKAWLEREQVAQFEFQKLKKKRDEEELKAQEQRDKIKREFEEAELRKKLIKEQKRKKEEEILRSHQMKLEEIRNYISGVLPDPPQSLLGLNETNPSVDECQYFRKTGVCRFDDRCSRNHKKSKLNPILIVKNFFRTDNFLNGFSLTNSDEIIRNSLEVNREFNEFFVDICEEFEKFGVVLNLLVCSNSEKHMMGNTFVEYSNSKSALAACYQLNGRFYGGQKLTMDFCHNLNWRTAVCGLALNNKCSRGSSCNYLHVFRNPGGKYPLNMNTINMNLLNCTPSPAVKSLNENTVDVRNSWNDVDKRIPARNHWRWSASPEPKAGRLEISETKEGAGKIKVYKSPNKRSSSRYKSPSPERRKSKSKKHKRSEVKSKKKKRSRSRSRDSDGHSRRSSKSRRRDRSRDRC